MLSILIPNRGEKYVELFLDEVERTLPVHEIVVCNDMDSKGKGWALRQAFNQSTGDIIAFLDGDGDIPPRMLLRLLPFIEDFDVVVGSKRITHSPGRRKIMTHVSRVWFKFLFGLKVDSQTGIKLFRRKALEGNVWATDSFVFDIELLYTLQAKGFNLVEVPIECEIKKQLTFKTIKNIFRDSLILWLKLKTGFLLKAI